MIAGGYVVARQRDQIGRFLKVFGDTVSSKSRQIER